MGFLIQFMSGLHFNHILELFRFIINIQVDLQRPHIRGAFVNRPKPLNTF